MSNSRHALIDFSEAGLNLDQDEMEEFVLKVGQEMESGGLVQDVHLERESDIPGSAKSGVATFLMGILTAEINSKNIRKVMDFLGNQFYGKAITLSGEIDGDGMTYKIEYRNREELDQATDAIERLVNLRIKISEQKNTAEK
jgi:hypothetical protein